MASLHVAEIIGRKGGAVVRTLASHQCGPGSNPGAGMWVEFVVGSLPCCKRFFSGYSGFPLSPKTNFPNSNSTRNQVDEEPLCGCATSKSLSIKLSVFVRDKTKESKE